MLQHRQALPLGLSRHAVVVASAIRPHREQVLNEGEGWADWEWDITKHGGIVASPNFGWAGGESDGTELKGAAGLQTCFAARLERYSSQPT